MRWAAARMTLGLGCQKIPRRLRINEPPPTTSAAPPVPNARTGRMWSEIDAARSPNRADHATSPRPVRGPFPPPEYVL